MKRVLSLVVGLSLIAVAVVTMVYAAGNNLTASGNLGLANTKVVKTYANSQVDTITYYREAGLSGLAFATHWKDSTSVTSAILYRMIDGVRIGTAYEGDTLTQFSSLVARGDTIAINAITLAPLADAYRIIITYAGSANGVTTPTNVYEFQKQFAK